MTQGEVCIVQEMGPIKILLTSFEVTVPPCLKYLATSALARVLGHSNGKSPDLGTWLVLNLFQLAFWLLRSHCSSLAFGFFTGKWRNWRWWAVRASSGLPCVNLWGIYYAVFIDRKPRYPELFQNKATLETNGEPGLSKPQYPSLVQI